LPDVAEKLAALGDEPVANSPEQFAGYLKSEIVRWGEVIRKANLKVE